jgi:hypothetical protein
MYNNEFDKELTYHQKKKKKKGEIKKKKRVWERAV